MQWRNTPSGYGLVSIWLHWLMAGLILAMFGLGLWMRNLGYYDAWYHDAPMLHKAIGILLGIALLIRLGWRMHNPRPTLLGQQWEQHIALSVHRLHYVLLFVLLITGYLIPTAKGVGIDVFTWFTVPAVISLAQGTSDMIGRAHLYLAWSVILLTAAHAAAALKHHIIDRDMTLRRMLGLSRKNV